MIPEPALDFKNKNEKYAEIILKSLIATPQDIEKTKKELKINITPKETVYSESGVNLYRFTPVKEKLHPIPVLMVPSLILRYYIMDLINGHSLIQHLVESGIDVYLIDWGIPGDEHGHLTFDYYIDTFLRRAVRQVCRRSGVEKINLMGQCLGGTLAVIFASLYPEKINRLICLTTPVDFEDAGLLSIWTNPETFDVDKVVDSFGNVVPPEFIHACFQFLDVKATVERYKKLYNNVLDDNFMYYYKALDCWLSDKIPFPGQVFRKFIKGLYQENQLSKGTFPINGRNADLKNITSPTLNLIAEFDHVFPRKSALKIDELVSGKVESHIIPAGHVTLIALFPVREMTFKLMSEFILRDGEQNREENKKAEDVKKTDAPPKKRCKKTAKPKSKQVNE